MRSKILLSVLLVGSGFGVGWITADRGKQAAPPVDLDGDITVRTALGEPVTYRPHSVHIDNRPTYRADVMPHVDAPVTEITFDGGRVKIACTTVTAGR